MDPQDSSHVNISWKQEKEGKVDIYIYDVLDRTISKNEDKKQRLFLK